MEAWMIPWSIGWIRAVIFFVRNIALVFHLSVSGHKQKNGLYSVPTVKKPFLQLFWKCCMPFKHLKCFCRSQAEVLCVCAWSTVNLGFYWCTAVSAWGNHCWNTATR
jgi:hypothetical protein